MKYESWKEAVDLSIKVWKVLAKKGHRAKGRLPTGLWYRIKHDIAKCPLCQHFTDVGGAISRTCPGCPLESCDLSSYYSRWSRSDQKIKRMFYAYKIVKKLKRWKKENK